MSVPVVAVTFPAAVAAESGVTDPLSYFYQLGGFAAAVLVGYWAIQFGEKKLNKSKTDHDLDVARAMALFNEERAEHDKTRQMLFESLRSNKKDDK